MCICIFLNITINIIIIDRAVPPLFLLKLLSIISKSINAIIPIIKYLIIFSIGPSNRILYIK